MGDGDHNVYTEDEERQLASQLHDATRTVYAGALNERLLRVDLVLDLHAQLFANVRSHAGRIRQRGRGSEYLTFGPNRSVANWDCPVQLERAVDEARRSLARLEPGEDYERIVFESAVRVHAEVVRIHPFEDGNGRTSRLLLNVVLVAHGIQPLEVEVVKSEYNECLNHYFRSKDLQPLVDLLLRTYLEPGKLSP